MKRVMLYEGWFSKKKQNLNKPTDQVKEIDNRTEIQKELEVPVIKEEDVQKTINEYLEKKKTYIRYMTMYKSRTDPNNEETITYYSKSILNFYKSCVLFYKLCCVKDIYQINIDFEKEFESLARFLIKREVHLDNHDKLVLFSKAIFFLNETYQLFYDDYDYENPQFYYVIGTGQVIPEKAVNFHWRKKEDINRLRNAAIDPLGEENWEN